MTDVEKEIADLDERLKEINQAFASQGDFINWLKDSKARCEARIAKLKGQQKDEYGFTVFERYWYRRGHAEISQSTYDGNERDKEFAERGRVHHRYEEAERADALELLQAKLRRLADELNGDWVADWKSVGQSKYYLGHNLTYPDLHPIMTQSIFIPHCAYFRSYEVALEALSRLTDEEKKLLMPEGI